MSSFFSPSGDCKHGSFNKVNPACLMANFFITKSTILSWRLILNGLRTEICPSICSRVSSLTRHLSQMTSDDPPRRANTFLHPKVFVLKCTASLNLLGAINFSFHSHLLDVGLSLKEWTPIPCMFNFRYFLCSLLFAASFAFSTSSVLHGYCKPHCLATVMAFLANRVDSTIALIATSLTVANLA